ncbi:hypothetical protein [Clostridium sp. HBUAS56010]|uniref:hypothetical protein n=1 Tax=Clostridium sp. HBUAS56010 TaxID=2571127 RepID=UPI0011788986|nr:hypothetical protein [Clostridium sp. HBUAS56010]
MFPVYISNTVIYGEFGFDYYGLLNTIKKPDDDIDCVIFKNLFQQIVLQSVKSNTITKICKKFGYSKNSMPKGILRNEHRFSKSTKSIVPIPDDGLLEEYDNYANQFIKNCGFNDITNVVDFGLYNDMLKYIKEKFEQRKLYAVKKLNKISLPEDTYKEVLSFQADTETKEKYQKHFKEIILDCVEKSVVNRINEAKEYSFKLNNKQKNILKDYFEQLSSRKLQACNTTDSDLVTNNSSKFERNDDTSDMDKLFDGKSLWGEPDLMENDFAIEEILDMPEMSDPYTTNDLEKQ